MSSLQQLQSGIALERTKTVGFGLTTIPALQIQYVGPALFAKVDVAAATGDVTVKADDIDGATTTIYTADVSTAAVDTYGELVDSINAQQYLRAFLIGVTRAESTIDTLASLAATNIRTANGLTLYKDAAVTPFSFGFAITNQKFVSRPTGGWNTKLSGMTTDENCVNALRYLAFTFTDATGTALLTDIRACDDINKAAAVSMWTNAWATTVAEEHGAAVTPEDIFIQAPVGQRLLVGWTMAGAAVSAITDFRATGSTKHLLGGSVPGSNYTGIN